MSNINGTSEWSQEFNKQFNDPHDRRSETNTPVTPATIVITPDSLINGDINSQPQPNAMDYS